MICIAEFSFRKKAARGRGKKKTFLDDSKLLNTDSDLSNNDDKGEEEEDGDRSVGNKSDSSEPEQDKLNDSTSKSDHSLPKECSKPQ